MTDGLLIEDVSHAFARHLVLQHVSMRIEHGEIGCLLGPSGCGKTTLLRVAAGLEPLQAGRIRIGDRVVAETPGIDRPPEERSVGLMFQDYALFPHLTVYENVTFGLGKTSADQRRRIEDRLEIMGLGGFGPRYPHELSGGQQQRVALLRAIAPRPAVLLLDEPFTGLDTALRSQIRDQTLEVLAAERQTAMMVTHDPEEAMYMANRLFVMHAGRIVQSGSPVAVYARPAGAFVAGLFGPLNEIDAVTGTDGTVATPLGVFDGAGLPSGTAVKVLIRPEHVEVVEDRQSDGACPASVVWSRSIGRSTQVRLTVPGVGAGGGGGLTARVTGTFERAVGDRVAVRIDRAHAFVFPADAT